MRQPAKNKGAGRTMKPANRRKISESEACDHAMDRMLSDVPKESRGYIVYRLIQGAGGVNGLMYPEFETCPSCGHNRLPVKAHNGARICRSCRTWVDAKAEA